MKDICCSCLRKLPERWAFCHRRMPVVIHNFSKQHFLYLYTWYTPMILRWLSTSWLIVNYKWFQFVNKLVTEAKKKRLFEKTTLLSTFILFLYKSYIDYRLPVHMWLNDLLLHWRNVTFSSNGSKVGDLRPSWHSCYTKQMYELFCFINIC
jgi:hypothetical protein